MKTLWDMLALAVFAGLIMLFLQRSVDNGSRPDPLWRYLAASIGCAVSNYLGSHGMPVVASAALLLTLAFIVRALRPFGWPPPR